MLIFMVLTAVFMYLIVSGWLIDRFEGTLRARAARHYAIKKAARDRGIRAYWASNHQLPTHHYDLPDHPADSTVNGDYNADLEQYGHWYGIDPRDEDAKRSFLSDLDQDEQEGQRG